MVHEVNDEFDDALTRRNEDVLEGRLLLSREEEIEALAIERS